MTDVYFIEMSTKEGVSVLSFSLGLPNLTAMVKLGTPPTA